MLFLSYCPNQTVTLFSTLGEPTRLQLSKPHSLIYAGFDNLSNAVTHLQQFSSVLWKYKPQKTLFWATV